jgi:spore coat protein A
MHSGIGPTRLWGYADAKHLDHKYLGGVIVATQGRPVKLKVTNLLPAAHLLPVDSTAIDPPMVKEVGGRVDRITVHLHGAFVSWTSDGGPMSWFTNAQNLGGLVHGSAFLNHGPNPGSALYDYPNSQSSRLVWYHDHAYGLTRLNAYAGLASAYLITDAAESMMIKGGILPMFRVTRSGFRSSFRTRAFFDSASDPAYPVTGARDGDIWYPHVYSGPPIPGMKLPVQCGATGRWNISGGTPPSLSLVPEAFFDTNLVNGAPYPVLKVSPRRYRFQALNAAQARFYNLQLYVADQSPDGITLIEKSDSTTTKLGSGCRRILPGPKSSRLARTADYCRRRSSSNDPPRPIGYLHTSDDDPRKRQRRSLQPADGAGRARRHPR